MQQIARPKPGYKHTQLGKIPESWQLLQLGEVSVNGGYTRTLSLFESIEDIRTRSNA